MKVNPVYKQETRASARSFRLPLVILVFNSVLAAVALLDMYSMIARVRLTAEIQYSSFLSLYVFVAVVEFVLLLLLIPALTAGSISGEREKGTLELLLTTRMSAADIVIGKLSASLSTVFLLIVSSFPMLALVFIYGGVTIPEVGFLLVSYAVTALLLGSVGICCSAWFSRTTFATVASYCVMGTLVLGTLGINQFVYLLMRAAAGTAPENTGAWLYLLLLNPASTFKQVIDAQMGGSFPVPEMLAWVQRSPHGLITEHWMLFGILAQVLLSAGLIRAAIYRLDPGGRQRRKRSKAERKQKPAGKKGDR